MVRPHGLYRAFGPAPEARQRGYRELFREHTDDVLLHEVRNTLNQESVLGTGRFKDDVETMLKRPARLRRTGDVQLC